MKADWLDHISHPTPVAPSRVAIPLPNVPNGIWSGQAAEALFAVSSKLVREKATFINMFN